MRGKIALFGVVRASESAERLLIRYLCRMMLRSFISLVRPEHWVKNLFIFIPAFFAARLSEMDLLARAMAGFVAFSLIASAVYVINDMVDAPQDRNHPDKRRRPLASGALGYRAAGMLLVLLLLGGFGISRQLGAVPLLIGFLYLIINLLYSFRLKNIAIVDISLIAVGFLLRVFMGGAVTSVAVSQWLIVLTFLLALILGLAKRRGEFIIATEGAVFRKSLEGYSLPFLDVGMVMCSTVAIVAYLMYCFSPEVTGRMGSDKIYYTAFFVVVGILRYLQLAIVFNKTESPTRALLRDGFLQVILLMWIASFAWLLYARKIWLL